MKRKICVVITARPSYARVKSVLQATREHPDLELQLVVGASALLDRYGDTVNYIKDDGFEITSRVYMVVEGENLVTQAKSTGLGLAELATVFDNLRPDVVVTVADRYETLATAAAATYMNIPVAHLQGGEVTGSIDEKVRHAVTKLSVLHFAANERAAERVRRMGEDPETVFVTGCPSVDLAASVLTSPEMTFNPFDKYGGVGAKPDLAGGYLVVLQHPVTTEYDMARAQVTQTLNALRDLGLQVLWFWPNVDAGSDGTSKGIRVFRELDGTDHFHFFRSFPPEDFLRLIYNCKCLVGNSSVALREGAFLGVPAVNIGTRQSGRDRAQNVADVGYASEEIEQAVQRQIANGRYPSSDLYGDGEAGGRIAELLASAGLTVSKHLWY